MTSTPGRGPTATLRVGAVVDARVVKAVLSRPRLWGSALGVVRRFAAPGWWRRAPRLPLPAVALWRFRMVTAYGDPEARPTPADVVDYLEWCHEVTAARRGARSAAVTVGHRNQGGDG